MRYAAGGRAASSDRARGERYGAHVHLARSRGRAPGVRVHHARMREFLRLLRRSVRARARGVAISPKHRERSKGSRFYAGMRFFEAQNDFRYLLIKRNILP